MLRVEWCTHRVTLKRGCRETRAIETPHLVRPLHPLRDWRCLGDLRRLIRDWKPDIVHTHSGKAGFIGRLAAKRAGVPKIIHSIHGPSFGPFQGWATNALFRGAERFAGRMTDHFVTVGRRPDGTPFVYNSDPDQGDHTMYVGSGSDVNNQPQDFVAQLRRYSGRVRNDLDGDTPSVVVTRF